MKPVNPLKLPLTFRVWVNGDLKRISLVHGQSVRFHHQEFTDEGWRSVDHHFRRDGMTLYFIHHTDGRDCDGRHSSYWEGQCHRDNLHSDFLFRHKKLTKARLPRWERVDIYVTDYEAQKAGY